MKIMKVINDYPVIPVVTINDMRVCDQLAECLILGGIKIVEVTLRTNIAYEAIKYFTQNFPDLIVGAGTVLTHEGALRANRCGASFLVTPGVTNALRKIMRKHRLAFLPGASTVSEVMLLQEYGFKTIKFFPAISSGGINFLKAIYPICPNVKFCPTGGINERNIKDFLSLPNVNCVGASFIASEQLIADQNWNEIQQRALWASKL